MLAYGLTRRERQVPQRVISGLPSSAIAAQPRISVNTVQNQRRPCSPRSASVAAASSSRACSGSTTCRAWADAAERGQRRGDNLRPVSPEWWRRCRPVIVVAPRPTTRMSRKFIAASANEAQFDGCLCALAHGRRLLHCNKIVSLGYAGGDADALEQADHDPKATNMRSE
jgi:hypothetical protein